VILTVTHHSDIVSDISGSIYGIYVLTFYFTFFLAYALTFYLTFYLASILTYFLAFYLASILPFYLAFYLASILTFYLAIILAFSLACVRGQACPTTSGRAEHPELVKLC
jgi:hypothetical protein